jgi:hypothetical protein
MSLESVFTRYFDKLIFASRHLYARLLAVKFFDFYFLFENPWRSVVTRKD